MIPGLYGFPPQGQESPTLTAVRYCTHLSLLKVMPQLSRTTYCTLINPGEVRRSSNVLNSLSLPLLSTTCPDKATCRNKPRRLPDALAGLGSFSFSSSLPLPCPLSNQPLGNRLRQHVVHIGPMGGFGHSRRNVTGAERGRCAARTKKKSPKSDQSYKYYTVAAREPGRVHWISAARAGFEGGCTEYCTKHIIFKMCCYPATEPTPSRRGRRGRRGQISKQHRSIPR